MLLARTRLAQVGCIRCQGYYRTLEQSNSQWKDEVHDPKLHPALVETIERVAY